MGVGGVEEGGKLMRGGVGVGGKESVGEVGGEMEVGG